jgi:hypothetical protein
VFDLVVEAYDDDLVALLPGRGQFDAKRLQQLVSEGERTSFGLSCGAVSALVEVEVLVPVAPTLRFPLV